MPRAHILAAAALVPLAIPAVATAAPTVTTDQPCYVADEESMAIDGNGFTPGGAVNLLFAAGGRFGTFAATADPAGAFHADVRAPSFTSFKEDPPSFNLFMSANDAAKMGPEGPIGPPEESAAFLDIRITEWEVEAAALKRKLRRGQRVKVETVGWTSAGDTLYVHYLRGGKAVYSKRVGALKPPCGDLTTSFKAFGFKSAKPGTYSVRFSASPKWNAEDRWSGFKNVRFAG